MGLRGAGDPAVAWVAARQRGVVSGRASFEGDRVRDASLTDTKVLRFTWRRLTRHPAAVAATVARELALRSPLCQPVYPKKLSATA